MPYDFSFFKENGIYIEKPHDVQAFDPGEGRVVTDHLSLKIRNLLAGQGGSSHDGDPSRQDSAVITAILSAGFSAADAYATFVASPRGRHAAERKSGHFEDYVTRTVAKAAGFLFAPASNGNGNNTLTVDFSKKRKAPKGEGLVMQDAHEIEAETTQWLWPGYIPAGKITILAGDPGMGKSTIAIDLVSRISRGTHLPVGGRTVSGTCLIASAEDAAEDTIIPRLVAAEANLTRIKLLREVQIDDETYYLTLPRDLDRLRDGIKKKGARLVVIDPLTAFLERGTDTYKDQDIRSVLAPMEALAEETGAAILIVAHLNKREDASTLYRVGGSIGFIGAARSVLAVTEDEHKQRLLYSLKSNLAKQPQAVKYETRQVTKIKKKKGDWAGETKIESSAVRWMGKVDFDLHHAKTPVNHEDDEARSFLKQVLSDSEVSADDIFHEARSAGVPRNVLQRMKTELQIKAEKKRDGKWYWRLGGN